MDVLTAPETTTTRTSTTRTSTRSRPRRWPSNADTAARRRSLGHDDLRTPTTAPATAASLTPPVDRAAEAPPTRRGTRVLRRRHLTPLDRARLAVVAALLVAATAAAAIPAHDNVAASAATGRPAIPAVTPAATTAPCSPVAVNCCPDAPSPIDIVRDLRPVCP